MASSSFRTLSKPGRVRSVAPRPDVDGSAQVSILALPYARTHSLRHHEQATAPTATKATNFSTPASCRIPITISTAIANRNASMGLSRTHAAIIVHFVQSGRRLIAPDTLRCQFRGHTNRGTVAKPLIGTRQRERRIRFGSVWRRWHRPRGKRLSGNPADRQFRRPRARGDPELAPGMNRGAND